VAEIAPSTNYGNTGVLQADGGIDPDVESYLKFTVTGLAGAPQSATLRLFIPNTTNAGSVNGPSVYQTTDTSWAESTITWDSRPAHNGVVLDDLGAVSAGTWVELDVTAAITGNGEYTFVLTTISNDATDFASSETGTPPQLLIIPAGGSTGTPTPTATPTPAPTSTVVPSPTPTVEPTPSPTVEPTPSPTPEPTATVEPTPTPEPTLEPPPEPPPEPVPTEAPALYPVTRKERRCRSEGIGHTLTIWHPGPPGDQQTWWSEASL
jgi:hypothetical protein